MMCPCSAVYSLLRNTEYLYIIRVGHDYEF